MPSSNQPNPTDALLKTVTDAFVTAYGEAPTALARAPGRVTLIGDHTDYAGGRALACAIDRDCVVAASLGTPGTIETLALDLGDRAAAPIDADPFRTVMHDRPSWMRYPAGVSILMRETLGPETIPGLRLALSSNVPQGGGLSSSAAIEVATATALDALAKQATSESHRPDRSRLCQQAEHLFAGSPCGLLDQLIATHAEPQEALHIDFADHSMTSVTLPEPHQARFYVLDSGIRHTLADGAYAERRAWCERARLLLGVSSLSDLNPADLTNARTQLDDTAARAAHHVVSENDRVLQFIAHLDACEYHQVGRVMNESHASLSRTYQVSTPKIDAIAANVRRIPGVFGCRMTGGGFGGHLVILAKPDIEPRQLSEAANQATGQAHHAFAVNPSQGAEPLQGP